MSKKNYSTQVEDQTIGEQIYLQWGKREVERLKPEYQNQQIIFCMVNSCRIFHGSISWAISGLTGVVTLSTRPPLQHWWVILQSLNAYYCVQIWVNNTINIYKGSTLEEMNKNGLLAAKKPMNSDIWTEYDCKCSKKLKEFVDYIKSQIKNNYKFYSNNCQHFSQKIYQFACRGNRLIGYESKQRNQRPRLDYKEERIKECTIYSCRLLHGSYSWLISGITGIFTLGSRAPLEHWWVILESQQAVYRIQVNTDNKVEITRGFNIETMNKEALISANRKVDSQIWKESKEDKKKNCNKTFGQIIQYIQSLASPESPFYKNNSQEYCKLIQQFACQ